MNITEQQLWDYMDGLLNEQEAQAIELAIKSNAEVKRQYEVLSKLNHSLQDIDLDEPSMSFTRNVMESIATEHAPVTLKTKVNNKIIYAISGFFICSLLFIIGYCIKQTDFTFGQMNFNIDLKIDKFLNATFIYAFIAVDLIIVLLFIDSYLRRKMLHK